MGSASGVPVCHDKLSLARPPQKQKRRQNPHIAWLFWRRLHPGCVR